MYTTDSRAINGAGPDGFGAGSSQRVGEEESGPAVEVIELANGETIWYVIDLADWECTVSLTADVIYDQVHCKRIA